MREVIFRAKPKRGYDYSQGKGWIYGSLIKLDENNYGIIEESGISYTYTGAFDYCHTPIQNETIGQFTGLLDSKGNKIFECDIVKRTVSMRDYAECDGQDIAYYEVIHFGCSFTPFCELGEYMKEYEVVGNIFDNP